MQCTILQAICDFIPKNCQQFHDIIRLNRAYTRSNMRNRRILQKKKITKGRLLCNAARTTKLCLSPILHCSQTITSCFFFQFFIYGERAIIRRTAKALSLLLRLYAPGLCIFLYVQRTRALLIKSAKTSSSLF